MQAMKTAARTRTVVLTCALIGCTAIPFPSFGFSILSLSLEPGGTRKLAFAADTNAYYILYTGTAVTNVTEARAMTLGAAGTGELRDTYPQLAAQFYRIAQVPLAQPLDTDGDGIDDVFELTHPGCLNPLDATDATGDCDGDARSNLQEYVEGTNPSVADGAPRLVINELDYDQVGNDSQEFLELLNVGTNTVNLAHYALVFINGANNLEYLRVPLVGNLAASHYLVVASTNVTVASGAQVLYFTNGENVIQNGAPDGVALVNVLNRTLMDALSYEGAITNASITGFPGTSNLVEGTALAASVADSNTGSGALIRYPDGADSHVAASDWRFTSTPTPGAANLLTP
jgi:hypothetical protein